jgi:hypothetical protein
MNDVIFLKESFLTRPQVTEYIRSKGYTITDRYIQSLAARRLGPPYRLFGTQAIYTIHDIDAWLDSPQFVKSRSRLPNPLIKTA